jgi:hypothetical protein
MTMKRICGRLRLLITEPGGETIERTASNLVLAHGAEIVARRFAGFADASAIDRVRVGFGTEAAAVDAAGLTPPPDPDIPPAALEHGVAPADFEVTTDSAARLVRVAIAARFTPTVELPDVTEAGLLAGTRLYNQVVFEPVTLRVNQDVTFFWEVDFPFGH